MASLAKDNGISASAVPWPQNIGRCGWVCLICCNYHDKPSDLGNRESIFQIETYVSRSARNPSGETTKVM
jgi:hypothetical protein